MSNPIVALIESRASASHFDPAFGMSLAEIERLIDLATRAPTAYNFQNWHFLAVRTEESKERLMRCAYGQQKVADAAVTFVI